MYEDKRYVLAVALFFAAAAQSVLAISLGHSNVRAPSHFEYNAGQYVADVVYRGRFTGHDAALFRDGSAALYPRSASADGSRKLGVRLRLLHASQPESVQADLPSDFRTHYLRDGDSGRNLTDVPHFGRIVFRNVYPGIDLAYHSSDGQLEYDFIVSPGAQPERISISIEGASKTEIDDAGDIVIWAGEHRLRQKRPVAFQLRNDKKIRVECAYRMDETGNVTLALGAYDKSRDLIIDPVVEYASYLGGTSIDQGKAVRLGPDGFIYVTGLTRSTKFPTLGAFDSTLGGNWDVFVSKVNPATGKLVYSTYLGGANEDEPTAIAIDSTGAAYVVGLAGDRFPTTSGAYQTGTGAAGFVAKISPTGSSLAYSTLVRGAIPTGVDIDVQGRAVVTGRAGSSFIPTSGALQTIYGGTTSAVDTTRDGDAFWSSPDSPDSSLRCTGLRIVVQTLPG